MYAGLQTRSLIPGQTGLLPPVYWSSWPSALTAFGGRHLWFVSKQFRRYCIIGSNEDRSVFIFEDKDLSRFLPDREGSRAEFPGSIPAGSGPFRRSFRRSFGDPGPRRTPILYAGIVRGGSGGPIHLPAHHNGSESVQVPGRRGCYRSRPDGTPGGPQTVGETTKLPEPG